MNAENNPIKSCNETLETESYLGQARTSTLSSIKAKYGVYGPYLLYCCIKYPNRRTPNVGASTVTLNERNDGIVRYNNLALVVKRNAACKADIARGGAQSAR